MIPSLAPLVPVISAARLTSLAAPVAAGVGLGALGASVGRPSEPRMAGQGPQGIQQGQMAVIDGELKAWMGPNFGWQSVKTYQSKTGKQPVGLEAFRKSAQYPQPEKAPGLDVPTAPVLPPSNYPATSEQAQQTGDPFKQELLNRVPTPEVTLALEKARLENFLRASEALAEQSYAKGVEISRRQAELERLRQWGALEQTRIAANLTGQALVAQSMYLSAVPNVSVIDAMNKGTATALAPFQFRLGVRGG